MSSELPEPRFSLSSAVPTGKFQEAKRIHLKPRLPGKVDSPSGPLIAVERELRFSCPACFEMLAISLPLAQQDLSCPACDTLVTPPRVAKMRRV
jgi:hypothetical protein